MDEKLTLLKNLGITIFVISSAGLVSNFQAVAETVEVSGGGKCEGDITADNLNGKVVCTYSNGDRFEGQFVDGKKQGQGTYTFADGGKYEGTFTNDAIAGEGVRTYKNGDCEASRRHRYEGEFSNGQPNEQGVYIGTDGGRYEGQFTDGEPSGQGTFTYANANFSPGF